MHICMYACMHICIYAYTLTHAYIYAYLCTKYDTRTHAHMYTHTHVCILRINMQVLNTRVFCDNGTARCDGGWVGRGYRQRTV